MLPGYTNILHSRKGTVVEAVQCAVAIQRELKVRNAELPPHRRMEFRIGINLGDVIAEGERIYGDGVNIAARLEGLAAGGGLCISGTVYDQVKTRLALRYEDLGARAVKNIAEPVRVYRVRLEPEAATPAVRQPHRHAARRWWSSVLAVVGLLCLLGVGVAVFTGWNDNALWLQPVEMLQQYILPAVR